jgi:aspartyl-tRNA(Asn)/glutamyl-tRNA(Gln) amidotransferase subunit A
LNYSDHLDKINKIKSGELSLTQNVEDFLSRIEEKKKLNCYNFIFASESRQQAELIEKKIKQGNHGKLAGMVVAVKDVLSIKNKPLTCSSNILKNFKSIYTATAVQKLIDEDAILIGKTNCDEFAMGSSNENSVFGAVLNPVDESRVPGGSSGGSAAALSAGLCDASIGTDTGGSIRQPAAFCGVFGLKPTYSRISRFGLTAFASSFDSIGPFAKNINDLSLLLQVMSGKDPLDSTSLDIVKKEKTKKIKVGIPKEYFIGGLDKEIAEIIGSFILLLKKNNIEVVEISLPHTEYTIAAYYILTTAEASSNLARYDGARYGFRADDSHSLEGMYKHSRSNSFGSEVKRRIMLGTYVLSSGYYDAYYRKAQKVRRLIKQDFTNAFKEVDIILTPTTPTVPFKIGEKTSDPLQMYLNDVFTTSANLAGIPGVSFPYSKNSEGLPVGIQLLADEFNDELIIEFLRLSSELK